MRWLDTLAVAAGLFLANAAVAQNIGSNDTEVSKAVKVVEQPGPLIDVDALRKRIQAILDERNIPGASIALVSKDKTLWAAGVGKADVATDVAATSDTLFRIGSASKSITAVAVLTQVERGTLDLNGTIRELAPEVEFTNRWADSHPITLAHVLEHTAAFDDIRARDYAKIDDPNMSIKEGLAYNPSSRYARWKPGTHMSYCNSGPLIAAVALENATGMVFEDYVDQHVFTPLGMNTADFRFPGDGPDRARGYRLDGITDVGFDHLILRPTGSMSASSKDMARFIRMLINRGNLDGLQLLKPDTVTRMETPKTTLSAKQGNTYGYGLGNYSQVRAGHQFHGHGGAITGFVSEYHYSSDLGLGYYVAVNKMSWALREIENVLLEVLLDGIEAPTLPESTVRPEELRSREGYYRNVTPRVELNRFQHRITEVFKLTVDDEGPALTPLLGFKPQRMVAVTKHSFRSVNEPLVTKMFVSDEGRDYFQGGIMGSNWERISTFSAWAPIVLAVTCVLAMLSVFPAVLIWVPLKLFSRLQNVKLATVLLPLLAVVSLGLTILLLMNQREDQMQQLGQLSLTSVGTFLGTLTFAALALGSVVTTYRSFTQDRNRFVVAHAALVTGASVIVMFYLGSHGYIGIRLWAY